MKLNEWLAEWMGWERIEITTTVYGTDETGTMLLGWRSKDGETEYGYWNPDTDHNDAFRVVEAMEHTRFAVEYEADQWGVGFIVAPDIDAEWHLSVGPSLPLAICLAAYKALNGGKEWGDE